jgi:hypothetical protein
MRRAVVIVVLCSSTELCGCDPYWARSSTLSVRTTAFSECTAAAAADISGVSVAVLPANASVTQVQLSKEAIFLKTPLEGAIVRVTRPPEDVEVATVTVIISGWGFWAPRAARKLQPEIASRLKEHCGAG